MSDQDTTEYVTEETVADADPVAAKRERVSALRQQIREEQARRAVATQEAATDVKLEALSEEERSLERQLETLRDQPVAGEDRVNVVVPEVPVEGSVNVTGESPREGLDPLAEGGEVAFTEVVDARGNLVRVPAELSESEKTEVIDSANTPTAHPEGELQAELTDPDAVNPDLGTREADAPPPEVPDDATMGRRGGRAR